MTILAIDTSGNVAGVCVDDGGKSATRELTVPSAHSRAILPIVLEAVAAAGVTMADLDSVAVAVGPGMFTSLRIGVATANGLGWSLGVPVTGVSTLAALAWQARHEVAAVCILDARRGDLFVARFEFVDTVPVRRTEDAIATCADAASLVQAGDTIVFGVGCHTVRDQLMRERPDNRYLESRGSVVEGVVLQATSDRATGARWVTPTYLRRPASLPTIGLVVGDGA